MSRQYRQHQVTVSLRAASVLTGEVLLNVQTKKTILSYGASGDVFRFIEQGTELVEFEDGTETIIEIPIGTGSFGGSDGSGGG